MKRYVMPILILLVISAIVFPGIATAYTVTITPESIIAGHTTIKCNVYDDSGNEIIPQDPYKVMWKIEGVDGWLWENNLELKDELLNYVGQNISCAYGVVSWGEFYPIENSSFYYIEPDLPPAVTLTAPESAYVDEPVRIICDVSDGNEPIDITIHTGRHIFHTNNVEEIYHSPGIRNITCEAVDYDGDVASASKQIEIIELPPENHPPTAQDIYLTFNETIPFTINLLDYASDEDGDPLTFSIDEGPYHGTAEINGANLTYTPPEDFSGIDLLYYKVCDNHNACTRWRLQVEYTNYNHPPIARDINVEMYMDTVLKLNLSNYVSDEDGDILHFSLMTNPQHGTFVQHGPYGQLLDYIPDEDFVGNDNFIYMVQDTEGAYDTATININVLSYLNQPPEISVEGQEIMRGEEFEPVEIFVEDDNTPLDEIEIDAVSDNPNVWVESVYWDDVNSVFVAVLDYNHDWSGIAHITFYATDSEGLTGEATAEFRVIEPGIEIYDNLNSITLYVGETQAIDLTEAYTTNIPVEMHYEILSIPVQLNAFISDNILYVEGVEEGSALLYLRVIYDGKVYDDIVPVRVIGTTTGEVYAEVNGPYNGLTGQEIVFSAEGSYGIDGTINSVDYYVWDLGNGDVITTYEPSLTYVYTQPGRYKLGLTVYSNGISSSDYTDVFVTEMGGGKGVPRNGITITDITLNRDIVKRGEAVIISSGIINRYKDIKDVVMKVTVKGIGSGSSYIGEIDEDDIGRASVTIRVPVNAVPRIYPVVVEFTGKVDGDYFRLRRVRYIKVR